MRPADRAVRRSCKHPALEDLSAYPVRLVPWAAWRSRRAWRRRRAWTSGSDGTRRTCGLRGASRRCRTRWASRIRGSRPPERALSCVGPLLLFNPGTVTVPYTAEIYDLQDGSPANNYDPVTSTFTAPVDGVYRFEALVTVGTSAGMGLTVVSLVSSNGAPPIQRWLTAPDQASSFVPATLSGDFLLAAGDTVIVQATAEGAGTINSFQTTFSGGLVAVTST